MQMELPSRVRSKRTIHTTSPRSPLMTKSPSTGRYGRWSSAKKCQRRQDTTLSLPLAPRRRSSRRKQARSRTHMTSTSEPASLTKQSRSTTSTQTRTSQVLQAIILKVEWWLRRNVCLDTPLARLSSSLFGRKVSL